MSDDQPSEVLRALPRTRPHRRSQKRAGSAVRAPALEPKPVAATTPPPPAAPKQPEQPATAATAPAGATTARPHQPPQRPRWRGHRTRVRSDNRRSPKASRLPRASPHPRRRVALTSSTPQFRRLANWRRSALRSPLARSATRSHDYRGHNGPPGALRAPRGAKGPPPCAEAQGGGYTYR